MFEWFMGLYQAILDNTKSFPQAQAALITTSSIFAAGAVGFLLIRLPKTIASFFKSQCMTSLNFNTSGTNWSDYNQMQYTAFLKWFAKNNWFNWSRVITLDGEARVDTGAVGPGVGTHMFFYNRRFFFFTITEKDSQGTSLSKYHISISVIGRSKVPIYALMDAFMEKGDPSKYITHFEAKDSEWNWVTRSEKRKEGTLVIQDNIQKELILPLQEFVKNKEWYYERGLDYKFCALLYGPPGTGKSSLARAIAHVLNRNLYKLSPDGGISYSTILQGAKGGIVLIEDIDAYGIARKRTGAETDVKSGVAVPVLKTKENKLQEKGTPQDNVGDAIAEFIGGSLSDLLNGLQGVIPLDDVIVLITTNHPEKLDPALIRDSRVDVRILVDYFSHKDIVKYIKIMYKEDYVGETFPPLPAATISKKFLENKYSLQGFVESVLAYKHEDNIFQLTANGE